MGLVILDTNILIYISKKILPIDFLEENYDYAISIITYMEILSYKFKTKKEVEIVRKILNLFRIIWLNKSIVEETIHLKQKYNLKLPDAIICATTIISNAFLITNDKDLFKIKELKIKKIKPES